MRPIKFRFGFQVGDSVLFKFMTLDEMLECDFPLESMIESINESFGDTHAEDVTEFKCVSKDQFTELTDKNGVDIYEGDIVSRDINRMYDAGKTSEEVNFSDGQFNSGDADLNNVVTSFNAEVIGNIHSNPELLEQ